MSMKQIKFMDLSFRDGFQSVLGARARTEDFLPALEAAVQAGTDHFEIGGGARFQSLYFYCQEDAFEMMDACRRMVGPNVNLQTLARGVNVVGLSSQPRDIINLHAKLFKKHGVTTIRNFDALNDVRNLEYSGRCISDNGLKHQIAVTLMGLPPGVQDPYPHSAEFYVDKVKEIMKAEISFHSLCFKDASGTTPPGIVYDTVKAARDILPEGVEIEMHTHCTAGIGVTCYMAAIEAGADVIDVAMTPVSGGTGAPDILTMWHQLKGTEYTLDIDYEKYLVAEEVFIEAMDKYFIPPEARETNPLITLSPMPGGALTANTQMMRDSHCLHLYPEVIKAMREVVERGGFGTSVTPVSQFYFQQAFTNVTQGPWTQMTDGYGKMVLGYFGRTPSPPDPEIVKIASEQLGLEPTEEAPVDLNDANPELGIEAARRQLQQAGLPETEENIFIVATCEEKGLVFLRGEATSGIRYKSDVPTPPAPTTTPPVAASPDAGTYIVTVNGQQYHVAVEAAAEGGAAHIREARPAAPVPAPAQAAPPQAAPEPARATDAPASAAAAGGTPVEAPLPGSVLRVLVNVGDVVNEGDVLVVLESMKMEVEVKALSAGTVQQILVSVGDTLKTGQPVVTF